MPSWNNKLVTPLHRFENHVSSSAKLSIIAVDNSPAPPLASHVYNPCGSLKFIGSPLTYAYRFQLVGFDGSAVPVEEWTHSNSLQIAPTGEILQSIRHLDTVIAVSSNFDRIAWRIGRFSSNFAFSDTSDKFYHQHFVRMLPNGHLLLFDNGNGRPAAEGGLYSRGLELALDWNTMTARKVWEYRHRLSSGNSTYKYSNSQGAAIRLQNGNTLVLFGSDIDAATLVARNPQTFTLVEADANPEADAVAVLDMKLPGEPIVYRVLPVETLFGESLIRRGSQ